MNKKYISIALLALIALAFAALFFRGCGGCGSRETRNPKPETVVVPAVDNPPVVAPPTVSVPIPSDPAPNAEALAELDHYRQRYAHYKAIAYNQGMRLAALDSLLGAEGLDCERRESLLRQKLAEHEVGGVDAAALIDELNKELAPRRDSGSAETADYRFQYRIDHFGSILPGGFVYDIDLKPRVVTCPECPQPLTPAKGGEPKRRNLTGFYGMGFDGRQRYGLEARRQWRRVSLSGLEVWDGFVSASGL
jgi:hypothetical protein